MSSVGRGSCPDANGMEKGNESLLEAPASILLWAAALREPKGVVIAFTWERHKNLFVGPRSRETASSAAEQAPLLQPWAGEGAGM